MRQKSQTRQTGAAKAIKDIRRATRKQYSAEEKIRIVLDGPLWRAGHRRALQAAGIDVKAISSGRSIR